MKAGWKSVKLGDACKIVNGATPSTSVEANWGGPHRWITPAEMGGLNDPYVGETRRTLTDAGLADCSASLLPTGSVILSSRAPIGHVIINTVPMATNQGCKSMIPCDDLDAKFLFYFIKASVPLLESLGTGATFKELSGGKLASVEIPLPPLAEQKRIVALLDKAFAGIDEAMAKAEANANNSMALWNAILHSTFSGNDTDWPLITLGNCCSKVTDGTHHSPKVQFSQRLRDTYPYVTSKNIRNNYIDLSKISYVEESFHREVYSRCKPAVGDVLLTKDGANTGQVVVNTIDEPFSLLSSVCLLKPEREMLSPHFLCYFLQSPQGTSSLVSEMTGAAIKRLILKTIKKATIPLPQLGEQNRLVKFLDEGRKLAERLHTNKERYIKLNTELKASLLSQAFAGELTA